MNTKAGITMPVFMSALILIGFLTAFGCALALPKGVTTPTPIYGIADNGTTITINDGSTFKVQLDENPTTGYSWNITLTPGLAIVNDTYTRGSNLIGAGGVHEWTVKVTGKGQQEFSGIYKRPWEPIAGNETRFALNVTVV